MCHCKSVRCNVLRSDSNPDVSLLYRVAQPQLKPVAYPRCRVLVVLLLSSGMLISRSQCTLIRKLFTSIQNNVLRINFLSLVKVRSNSFRLVPTIRIRNFVLKILVLYTNDPSGFHSNVKFCNISLNYVHFCTQYILQQNQSILEIFHVKVIVCERIILLFMNCSHSPLFIYPSVFVYDYDNHYYALTGLYKCICKPCNYFSNNIVVIVLSNNLLQILFLGRLFTRIQ